MATVKQIARRLRDGKPGHRFVGVYEFRKKHPPHLAVRIGLWVAAVLLMGGGLAIGWLPGPGGFIGIFGVAIIAMEFRVVARICDRLERFLRRLWARVTHRGPAYRRKTT